MIRRALILTTCLSVFTLGLSSFDDGSFGDAAFAAEDPAEISGQAKNLRNLFEVAGRNGLVNMRGRPGENEVTAADATEPASVPEWTADPADCQTLTPLFGGGQGDFALGLFTELATDGTDRAALASALADLIDLSYSGQRLPVDLRNAAECGPSFLPWQALADPGRALGPADEATLAVWLGRMSPPLRRQLGVQIAIRAGMAGNIRLARRIADSLSDSGLHGQSRHDYDVEHVLLDAILKTARDPIGARARLAWVAERDGPEQLYAIDLMSKLDAAPAAKTALTRLSNSPDPVLRLSAQQRLLARAIEDSDIELVAELVTTRNNLTDDADSLARLTTRLEEAVGSNDPLKVVQALDVIERLDANGVVFDSELKSKAAERLKALAVGTIPVRATDFASTLAKTTAPEHMSGPALTDYLGELSSDLETFQEVLGRG
ncbi:hypothetical protein GCM10007853_22210 [Algimonas ampicilliniresistens]|uniref:HEAT repeat domain-containing protein n=1 Tax=Algimonas ampicilliniresistens TaxID=1298735 RepID=A0ABQ5VBI2_9PROT|nr:hypothetical protein [Algimonas ampicilliniresistens]GLQ24347.1 hypothetical protein GCM10007853_22210 [Algimonas ampicilliniresistens]